MTTLCSDGPTLPHRAAAVHMYDFIGGDPWMRPRAMVGQALPSSTGPVFRDFLPNPESPPAVPFRLTARFASFVPTTR